MQFPADTGWERQHLEVVVELKDGADPVPVVRHLQRPDLDIFPLVTGILITGEAGVLSAALGADPRGVLPVPEELADAVSSIRVVPPKELRGNPSPSVDN